MKEKVKLLLAEDEPVLGQIVKENLESKGFHVSLAKDGSAALRLFRDQNFDLLILDVMMPVKDGFSLAKEIRQLNKSIPILFLTAKSQPGDVVTGFNVGGNDYLKKPFSVEELVVRIKNLLGSLKQEIANRVLTIGKFSFDYKKQKLVFEGTQEELLTAREAELLFYLYQNKNEVLDRSFALKQIWGNDDFFSGRSMDVFISKLRKKLEKDSSIQIINIRGYGYKLVV